MSAWFSVSSNTYCQRSLAELVKNCECPTFFLRLWRSFSEDQRNWGNGNGGFCKFQDDAAFEDERCVLCMDIIVDRGVLDCCQHWFCFACIDNWATITDVCPFCQEGFQLITCIPVYDTIQSSKVDDDSVLRY
ncbi:uncharacterized protein LOC122081834 isoform X2 [Macadamia integrifolia]|uniref:uncharacterized protein LOC122081834 isoform X2 n=1 Tax=Macadamia integrifolia TaxID=60698 RepID=UPI001C4F2435|nr:uncharacterized protein LOC122081834 isoform X2 [Macadamia integrifolia]